MKRLLCFTLVVQAFIACRWVSFAATGKPETTLWYAQPARQWTEALPVGNGRMGAMVFGTVPAERIQFNEDTLWKGGPHDYVPVDAAEQLPVIRRMLGEGKTGEAGILAREKFLSYPIQQNAYQPFGDLHLQFPEHERATDYRRELDLDAAVARTTYRVDEVSFRREVFASYPDQVIAVRLTADHRDRISFTLSMDSPHTNSKTRAIAGDTLSLTGQMEGGGLKFESRVRLLAEGGRTSVEGNTLKVEDANSAVLFLTAATSFRNFQDGSADPAKRCTEILAKVIRRKFDRILADHMADHRRLFRRVTLDLGQNDRMNLPTDERLSQVMSSGLQSDPALAALDVQYGRYLLIASSRSGSEPANLQGKWNELPNPPSGSNYKLDVNLEMNYWPAEIGNLGECDEPLFNLIDGCVATGSRTAKEQYGARGWVVHQSTDLWRSTASIDNIDEVWPTGGAWLCYQLWEHYLFTGDKRFLGRRAYPVMKSACEFFMDSMVKDPKTAWLITSPSYSREQGAVCSGSAMDHQLIRALMDNTLEAAHILGTDRAFCVELAKVRKQVAPDLIGKHGQLQEWLEDVDVPNNNHPHMSPLFALYPGCEITPATPALYEAAKVFLKWRGEGSAGWSYAWRMALWARVGNGETAFHQFNSLIQKRTLPNLLDLGGSFQIDGNFGATAGVMEMLLQSHQTEVRDEASKLRVIEMLPALPKAWPKGSVTGLCARDGFEVDIVWENGALARAAVRSKLGRRCLVRTNGREVELRTKAGKEYVLDPNLKVVR